MRYGVHQVHQKASGVAFSFFGADDVESLSVKAITNAVLVDNLGRPTNGGLYDPALGPTSPGGTCETCGQKYDACPGHIGHIKLVVPVFQPLLFEELTKIVRCVCFHCRHFMVPTERQLYYVNQLRLLDAGLLADADAVSKIAPAVEGDDMIAAMHEKMKKELSEEGWIVMRSPPLKGGMHRVAIENRSKHTLEQRRKVILEFMQEASVVKKCFHCGMIRSKMRFDSTGKIFRKTSVVNRRPTARRTTSGNDEGQGDRRLGGHLNADGDAEEEAGSEVAGTEHLITPTEVEEVLSESWANDPDISVHLFCNLELSGTMPAVARAPNPSMFFVRILAVPANRFRPPIHVGDMMFEHPQNRTLGRIISANANLVRAFHGERPGDDDMTSDDKMARAMPTWLALQDAVNVLVDSNKASTIEERREGSGVKQLLEKKEGMFRKFMMGKRVNYAARSVISPDPYIGTDEIGVPEVFARSLTFPTPVTQNNVSELRRLVINGPDVHPGANFVEEINGRKIDLSLQDASKREAIARQLFQHDSRDATQKTRTVHRHLRDGDCVLMNRQPTLHRPGIMAHRVRVLKNQKTIRMHYANCNTYNADFDGDEMNMHFPQDLFAQSEARELLGANDQYIVPTSGEPIRGLIQDHVVAGVMLCCRNRFFSRGEVMQLLFSSMSSLVPSSHRWKLIPPAIIFPKPLWTGKQIISIVIQTLAVTEPGCERLKLNYIGKTKTKAAAWSETTSPLQIVPETKVIIRQSELLVGVMDKAQIGHAQYGMVHACFEMFGAKYAGRLLTGLGRLFTIFLQTHQGHTCGLEDIVLTPEAEARRQEILKEAITKGTETAADFTELPHSTTRGEIMKALRKKLNDAEDSAMLDQVAKPPLHDITSRVQKMALPGGQRQKFPKNNLANMTMTGAKGSDVNFSQISCLLGQQELEGKRVPRTVAGKTCPAYEPYDPSAAAGGYIRGRFLTGISPQEYYFHCMAGREGLVDTAVKTSRSGYLQRCLIKHLEGLTVQYDSTVRDSDGAIVQFLYGEDGLDTTKTGYLDKLDFFAANYHSFATKFKKRPSEGSRSVCPRHAEGDPVISYLEPSRHVSAVSEAFDKAIDDHMANAKSFERATARHATSKKKGAVDNQKLRRLLHLKYQNALVNPGENVGVLAGQSVGEPSTQMTLNTFHLAGHGAVNVTMGIPRLREIVMTASPNIKSPIMYLPLKADVTEERGRAIAGELCKVTLADCLDSIHVREVIIRSGGHGSGALQRRYIIKLVLGDLLASSSTKSIDRNHALSVMTKVFPAPLGRAVSRQLKTRGAQVVVQNYRLADDERGGVFDENTDSSPNGARGAQAPTAADGEDSDHGEDHSDAEDEGAKAEEREAQRRQAGYGEESEGMNSEADASDADPPSSPSVTSPEVDYDQRLDQVAEMTVKCKRVEKDTQSDKTSFETTYFPLVKAVERAQLDRINGECMITVMTRAEEPRLQMVSLCSEVAKMCIVREVPGLKRAVLQTMKSPDALKRFQIQTEGINFDAVSQMLSDEVDLGRMCCNNVWDTLKYLGVEAARESIVREIVGVFSVYGIDVNRRHLSLIADAMTFHGDYKGFNRGSMRSHTSPWAKMSFESCVTFLTQAAARGEYDDLRSPSSSIVVGQIPSVGTGVVQLQQPFNI